MIVCICDNLTESQIIAILDQNPGSTLEDIQNMNICDNCFKCSHLIQDMIESIDVNSR